MSKAHGTTNAHAAFGNCGKLRTVKADCITNADQLIVSEVTKHDRFVDFLNIHKNSVCCLSINYNTESMIRQPFYAYV